MHEKFLTVWRLHTKSYLNEWNNRAFDDLSTCIDENSEDNNLISFVPFDENDKLCGSLVADEEGLSRVAEVELNLT